MFGGSCSLKGGYKISNKRHYLKRKSLRKRTKSLKKITKSLRRKSLKKRGGGKHTRQGAKNINLINLI
tara:strand:- start:13 stop:216 length:204 start_codon:yes stop_codon:yes gene_type:complete